MKKFEWKIELLNQIPLIAAISYFWFAFGYFFVVLIPALYLVQWFGEGSWISLLMLLWVGLILIGISLCFVRWWKPWLVGIPVQLAVYGCVWYVQHPAYQWDTFASLAGSVLFSQAVALLIKSLIRRRKAKKAILESEVTEG